MALCEQVLGAGAVGCVPTMRLRLFFLVYPRESHIEGLSGLVQENGSGHSVGKNVVSIISLRKVVCHRLLTELQFLPSAQRRTPRRLRKTQHEDGARFSRTVKAY